ncbi:MAG: hypothetical protein RR199_01190 [Alistipes sp.]
MKQEIDWTNVVREALRDVEMTPPEGGWARLEHELKPPRLSLLRTYWPRVAVAAALVICVAAGALLWRAELPESGTMALETSTKDRVIHTQTAETSEVVESTTVAAAKPATSTVVQRLRAQVATLQIPVSPEAAQDTAQSTSSRAQPAAEPQKTTNIQPKKSASTTTQTTPQTTTPTPKVSPRSSFDEAPFVAYVPPRKQASFALFAGGGVTGSSSEVGRVNRFFANTTLSGGVDGVEMLLADYDKCSFRHHQPLSFGLAVRKEFAHGLSLESGVNYSYLRSDVRMAFGADDLKQTLHFIGVPLRLNWNYMQRRHFLLYIGAGGMVEKCVSAKFGSTSINEGGVQWSVAGAAGVEYRLGGLVGLYFEPEVSYYLNQTQLRTARTDSPLTLTLRLGVRLSF